MTRTVRRGGPVDLRPAFRPDAASVWVVTSAHDLEPAGFTATSVSSVSLDPPIVSFNVGRTASSRLVMESSGRAAVHLLAEHQRAVAMRWAGPVADRFAPCESWHWHDDDLPALKEPLVRLSGDVLSFTEAGDSLVVLLEVLGQEVGDGSPLLHHHRTFRPLDRDFVGALL